MEPVGIPPVEVAPDAQVRTRKYKYQTTINPAGDVWSEWYDERDLPVEIQKVFEDDALITHVRVTYDDLSKTQWSFDYEA